VQTRKDSNLTLSPPRRPTPAAASHSDDRGLTPARGSPPARIHHHSKTMAPSGPKNAAMQTKHDAKHFKSQSVHAPIHSSNPNQNPKCVTIQRPFMPTHSPPVQVRRTSTPAASFAVATGYDARSSKSQQVVRNTRMHVDLKPSSHQNGSKATSSAGNGSWHPETGTVLVVTRSPLQASLARHARLQAQPMTSTAKITVNRRAIEG
jgi:hypothetical protein